jgi:hypothetical protein
VAAEATPLHTASERVVKPQSRLVLGQLRRRGDDGLTPRQALDSVGVYRLSGRILELRQAGYSITTTRSRGGYAIYRLVGEPEERAA